MLHAHSTVLTDLFILLPLLAHRWVVEPVCLREQGCFQMLFKAQLWAKYILTLAKPAGFEESGMYHFPRHLHQRDAMVAKSGLAW